MTNYIVYKLTRDDGKMYIGTTSRNRLRTRLTCHRKHKRFVGHTFEFEVLEESDTKDVWLKESHYIAKFDTFHNGLNLTWSGRGQHHASPNFSTHGYVFSEESRRKMSVSAKRAIAEGRKRLWNKGVKNCFSSEVVDKIRKGNRGKRVSRSLSIDQQDEIINRYGETVDGVGVVQKNGRRLSYIRAFALKMAPLYGVTPENIVAHIKRRGLDVRPQ